MKNVSINPKLSVKFTRQQQRIVKLLDLSFRYLQHDSGAYDVEWVESRKHMRNDFCKVLGVPIFTENFSHEGGPEDA